MLNLPCVFQESLPLRLSADMSTQQLDVGPRNRRTLRTGQFSLGQFSLKDQLERKLDYPRVPG